MPATPLFSALVLLALLATTSLVAGGYTPCSDPTVCSSCCVSVTNNGATTTYCCPGTGNSFDYDTKQCNTSPDCTLPQSPPASTCPLNDPPLTCTSGKCWFPAGSNPNANCHCSGGAQAGGATSCSECTAKCNSYGRTYTGVCDFDAGSYPAASTNINCTLTVDGVWSDWTACNVSCGGGTQARSCSNPAPSGDGAPCVGASEQTCNTVACSDPSTGSSTGAGADSSTSTGADSLTPAGETISGAKSTLSASGSILFFAGAAVVANGMRAIL